MHIEIILNITLSYYISLVDLTGRVIVTNKKGVIGDNIPPILERLGIDATAWIDGLNQLKTEPV